ncbi:MAG: hypothetical protein ACREFR_03850 [Limisphaerales bacterium]
MRRLLALKRHEVPPPGYFENFSSKVIGRIRAAQAAREVPWILRFIQAFEAKPIYPVGVASALCLLLLFGIVSVEQGPVLVTNPVISGPLDKSFSIVPDSRAMAIVNDINTNPPADLPLFGSAANSSAAAGFQTVSFSPDGN